MLRARREKGIFILTLAIDFILKILLFPSWLFNLSFKRKPASNFKNILIIELWGIGDLVMMGVILESLKRSFPGTKISLLSKPQAKVIFKDSGLIQEYIEFEFPWTKFKAKYRFWKWDWQGIIGIARYLKAQRFDLSMDARGDFRNNLLSFIIGAKRRIGYAFTGGSYFLTEALSSDFKTRHRIDAWLNLLKYLGLKVDSPMPYLALSKEDEVRAADILSACGIKEEDPLIGIHPGAKIKVRCWPLERFARVAEYARDKYKVKIIVFVEPDGYGEDMPIAGEHIKLKASLRELMALIKKLRLLVCNESGPMHLACALGVPVIAIFGPGSKASLGPCGPNDTVVNKENITCRPCFDYCRFSEPFCISGISTQEVFLALDKQMRSIEKINVSLAQL